RADLHSPRARRFALALTAVGDALCGVPGRHGGRTLQVARHWLPEKQPREEKLPPHSSSFTSGIRSGTTGTLSSGRNTRRTSPSTAPCVGEVASALCKRGGWRRLSIWYSADRDRAQKRRSLPPRRGSSAATVSPGLNTRRCPVAAW